MKQINSLIIWNIFFKFSAIYLTFEAYLNNKRFKTLWVLIHLSAAYIFLSASLFAEASYKFEN